MLIATDAYMTRVFLRRVAQMGRTWVRRGPA